MLTVMTPAGSSPGSMNNVNVLQKKNAAILTGGSAAPYIHVQAPIQELQKKKAMR